MDNSGFIIIIVILIMMLGYSVLIGNGILIISVVTDDTAFLSYDVNPFFVFVAIIADVIILVLLWKNKLFHPVSMSFHLASQGLKNKVKKISSFLAVNRNLKQENTYSLRLDALRKHSVDKQDNMRVFAFCQLMQALTDNEELCACYAEVKNKNRIIDEIQETENKLLEIANIYKNAGNIERAKYILEKSKIPNNSPNAKKLEKEYLLYKAKQKKENKELIKWTMGSILVFIFVIIIIAV